MTAKRMTTRDWIIVLVTLTPAGTAAQASAVAQASNETPGSPEFYRDVLPILQENCQACHRINGKNMHAPAIGGPLRRAMTSR